jgi:hypothetical protein
VTGAVLYVDGTQVGATYNNGALTPSTQLGAGAHTFGYGYVGPNGTSASSPTMSIRVDTTTPSQTQPPPTAAPTSYIDNVGPVQSNTSTAPTTDDTTPGINIGTLPAGVTNAVLYVDSAQVPATYNSATGAITPTSPLGAGAHTIGYGYVGPNGTSASSPTMSITVDTTTQPQPPPTTAPTNYIDNVGIVQSPTSTAATTDDTTPGINIGALPAGVTGAVLFVDGTQVGANYSNGALTPSTQLGAGAHTFGYGYVGPNGTSASSPTMSITIDTTAPNSPTAAPTSYVDNVGPVQSTTSTAPSTDDTTPGFNIGTLPSGVTGAVLYMDGQVISNVGYSNGVLTPSTELAGGPHTFGYGHMDAAGNVSTSSPTMNLTIEPVTSTGPRLSSTIDNCTNFDVRSDIVLTSSQAVTAVAGKYIHIINDANGNAYNGYDSENTAHNFDILATNTTISADGTKITINPDVNFDLDLANNYHITVDSGAFVSTAGGLGNVAVSELGAMNFSTINPGEATSTALNAVASTMMTAGTDAMTAGSQWAELVNVDQLNETFAFTLSGGKFVLLLGHDKDPNGGNAVTFTDGIDLQGGHRVYLKGLAGDDSLYIDDQFNNAAQMNDLAQSYLVGTGSTGPDFSTVNKSILQFSHSGGLLTQANLAVGETAPYDFPFSVPDLQNHAGSQAVLCG